ncbi:MAG: hypothetical protein IJ641_03580 [Lachnospiraceae bacterium]|nr:hypothetical protein [Lachnospiraceae bacterium]
MKKTLKNILHLFTNNIGIKILALLLSVMIWLVVVSIDNPVKDQNFTQIPVTVLNGDVFEASGQAYELADSSSTVTVTARAERSVLSQLSRDDFSATIDMNNYANGRVPISVKANRLSDKIVSLTPRTAYATVDVEELGTKQFSIDYEITGEPAEGYSVGEVNLASNVVRVQGPESVVETIDRAVVRVSVQGMTRDMRTETPIIFIDRNGEDMDSSRLELSRTSISVTVEIWEDREVPVSYSYTGIPAEGFATTGNLTATINTVSLSGDADALSGVGSITVPSDEIDITGATENYTTVIDVAAYLPSGTSLADKDMDTHSTVTVEIVAMNLMNVEVPVSNITIDNVPEGFAAEIGSGATSVVTSIRGLPEVLATVDGSMLTGHIDMADVKVKNGIDEWVTGLYDADVTFAYPEGVYSSGVVATTTVFLQPEMGIPAGEIESPVETDTANEITGNDESIGD